MITSGAQRLASHPPALTITSTASLSKSTLQQGSQPSGVGARSGVGVRTFPAYDAQRWQVELDIRSSKTHMQMDHLRCKSPSMVRKEIYAHMISYNLIRDLIVRTALRYSTSPKCLSHTGAVQTLHAFSEKLQAGCDRLAALEDALLESISEHPAGDRKPRVHPREIKRRPKPYQFMSRPRRAA